MARRRRTGRKGGKKFLAPTPWGLECEKVGSAREKRLLEFSLEGGVEEEDQPVDCG